MSWARVVVAVPTYSGTPRPKCQASLNALAGAKVVYQEGLSDVCQARSGLYSYIVEYLRQDYDVVLCVDDDIAFDVETALRVVSRAMHEGRPVSAVYGMQSNQIAATRIKRAFTASGEQLWNVGLGFVAIPMQMLAALGDTLPLTLMGDRLAKPFCTSTAVPSDEPLPGGATHRWMADDYSFCNRLGGVLLEPVAVRHLKMVTHELEPDEESLRRLAHGEPLDPDPSPLMQGAVALDDAMPATADELPAWRRRARKASAAAQLGQSDARAMHKLAMLGGPAPIKPFQVVGLKLPETPSPAPKQRGIPKRGWREAEAARQAQANHVVQMHEANQVQEPEPEPEADPEPMQCSKCGAVIVDSLPLETVEFPLCLECATAPDAERSEQEQADPGLRSQPAQEAAPTTAR
jgi:hypothetical protein